MKKIFASPSKYIQGPNVLFEEVNEVRRLGNNILLLCDDFVWEMCGKSYVQKLCEEKMCVMTKRVALESSSEIISELNTKSQVDTLDVVIGLGGGKIIDLAKSLSATLELKCVIAPTAATTDAPTSSLAVIYNPDKTFSHYECYQKHPDLIIVDTGVIAKAPAKFLAAGIADGLATWVEAEAVVKSGGKNFLGGQPTIAAQCLAKSCEDILFTYGIQAYQANQINVITEPFELVVEANTLLSGLGFENCGLALAHALNNAMSELPGEIQRKSHGEKVAFGTLVQLVIQNAASERINQFLNFYLQLELPITLKELSLDKNDIETLNKIAKSALKPSDTTGQLSQELTEKTILDAMLYVDKLGRELSLDEN